MVKRIFWEDSYKKECISTIVSIKGNNILFDQTVAYAFSGGQISDSATINGIEILSAQINENYNIEYEVEDISQFSIGQKVTMKINWEKRYNLMKLHTAQHIVGEFIEKKQPGIKTSGSNIRDSKATLTYVFEENINTILPEVEFEINNFLHKKFDVQTSFDKHNINRRIWKCDEFNCFCGGTHIRNTNEIGKIKLKRKNSGKNSETVEITLESN